MRNLQKYRGKIIEKELAPSTLIHYKVRLEKRIIPAIGHLELSRIQPQHLLEFYFLTYLKKVLDIFLNPKL